MPHETEANIMINGEKLTFAQSMTVRVAMSSFTLSLQADGLGDDEHGNHMYKSYLKNIREINKLIFKSMSISKDNNSVWRYCEDINTFALHTKLIDPDIHDNGYAIWCFKHMWE